MELNTRSYTFLKHLLIICVVSIIVLNTEYSKEHRVDIIIGQNVHSSIVFNSKNLKMIIQILVNKRPKVIAA